MPITTTKKLSKDDIPNILALYREFRPGWELKLDWNNVIDNFPSVGIWHKEELIGFIYCCSFAPDIIEIANIYIKKDVQSKGYGSKLIEELEGELKNTRFSSIILTNSDGHADKIETQPATEFYFKNNYQLITETTETRVFFKNLNNIFAFFHLHGIKK